MPRLFFALEPDETTRALAAETIVGLRLTLRPGSRLGFTRADRLHATVAFLGEIDEKRIEAITAAAAVVARAHAAFVAVAGGLGAFPAADRARVIWLGFGPGCAPLLALAGDLQSHLRAVGLALEERPFTGHLTLARCRSPRGFDVRPALATAPDRRVECAVRELVLFESVRDDAGARYVARFRAPLASAIARPTGAG